MRKKIFVILAIGLNFVILFYFYGLPYLGEKAFEKGEGYYYSQQYTKAIKAFKIAKQFGKDKLKPLILLGYAYKFKGELDEAVKTFRKVLFIDPKNDEASGGLVDCLFLLKLYEEAEKEALKRLKYVLDKEDVYVELAEIYYAKRQFKKAQEYAIKNVYLNDIKDNPINYRVGSRLLLAGITYNLGEYDKVIHILQEAQTLSPDTPLIYKSLAQVYEKIGDKQKALENWQKVAELDKGTYDSEFRTQVQSKIHQLQEELAKEETEP